METALADISVADALNALTEEQLRDIVRAAFAELDVPVVLLDPAGRVLVRSRGALRLDAREEVDSSSGAELRIAADGAAGAKESRWEARPLRGTNGRAVGTLLLARKPQDAGENVLEELASHVAHEMRNPLGTIGGFATLLEREFGPEDRRRRWTRKIIDAVARLDRIVTQLHLYVGPVKSQPRPVDLVERTREVLSFAEMKFGAGESGVTFECDFPASPVYVLLDPHWWQEVLLIICSNAIQALGEDGRVTVRITSDEDCAQVTVTDNGIGIPAEMQGKLFYPFFSSRPDGTGLGLAVARKLLSAMDASIDVRSEAGKGTIVTITFPVA